MSSHEQAKDALSRAAMAQKAKDEGYNTITIRYSGSGDSGQIDEIVGTAPGDETEDELEGELYSAFEILGAELIDSLHTGWENNEGGYGEIVINLKTNEVNYDHNDYIQDVSTTTHYLDFLTGEETKPSEDDGKAGQ